MNRTTLLALCIVLFLSACSDETPRASHIKTGIAHASEHNSSGALETLKEYHRALQAKDYTAAYELLSKEDKETLDFTSFAKKEGMGVKVKMSPFIHIDYKSEHCDKQETVIVYTVIEPEPKAFLNLLEQVSPNVSNDKALSEKQLYEKIQALPKRKLRETAVLVKERHHWKVLLDPKETFAVTQSDDKEKQASFLMLQGDEAMEQDNVKRAKELYTQALNTLPNESTLKKTLLDKESALEEKKQRSARKIEEIKYASKVKVIDIDAHLEEVSSKKYALFLRFGLQNLGEKKLSSLKVAILYKNEHKEVIERRYFYPLGQAVLKAKEEWHFASGSHYSDSEVPQGWKVGNIRIEVVEVKFED